MKTNMAMTLRAAALAAAFGLGLTGAVSAQDRAPKGAPPPWDALVKCAETADDDASLACFRSAMRAAGYAAKPEAVAEEHRHRFGLSMPKLGVLRHQSKEAGVKTAGQASEAPKSRQDENDDGVTVTLAQVATLFDGKLLFITADGAIWEQLDEDAVDPRPKQGMEMLIHKGQFGGDFCDASKYKSVRCQRTK